MDQSRKQFLQTSAVLLASAFAGSSFQSGKAMPLLSFSTLGCPDWDFGKIIDFAVQHGYKGIEMRGLRRELDLPKCPEFNSAQSRAGTVKRMEDKGLHFVGLGSSATLHFADPAERKKNLEDARRFINLAADIRCPYIRVFPNNFPKDQDRAETIDLIITGLLELAGYAKEHNVTVLLESHGDLVKIADLETIMQAATHTHVGLIWDIANMWTVTKEPPTEAYNRLKNYIRHIHVKDARLVDGKLQYTFLGQGEVPIFGALDILAQGGYTGYYSFEWEKLWHPEIAEPEVAFADYTRVMNKHFK